MDSRNKKTILISCVVIFLITVLCLCLILTVGIGVGLFWPLSFGNNEIDFTLSSEKQRELPANSTKIALEIEQQVEQIRGLPSNTTVPRILMTQEELEEIVVNDFFSDYSDEDARQDVLVYSMLGLLPKDFDLKNFYTKLYSEQISGFYDRDTGEIYVLKGMRFGGNEKLIYAHEFTHALQDQQFKFEKGLNYNENACKIDSERCAAIQALIEGDASKTEMLWFQTHASPLDYFDIMRTVGDFSSPVMDEAPAFMSVDLYFPYENGLSFVEYLYDQDGFASIDAAYDNLPLSTEQIMHPERYPWDKPVEVSLKNLNETLGKNWSLLDKNIMGEWFTYLILSKAYDPSHRLPDEQAKTASEGWGGDAYAIYYNEFSDELVFVLDIVWDTSLDADEFVVAISQYADLRWTPSTQQAENTQWWKGQDTSVALFQKNSRTLWMIAPNEMIIESLLIELK